MIFLQASNVFYFIYSCDLSHILLSFVTSWNNIWWCRGFEKIWVGWPVQYRRVLHEASEAYLPWAHCANHPPVCEKTNRRRKRHIKGAGKVAWTRTHARVSAHSGGGPDSNNALCQVSLGSVCQNITFTLRHGNEHFLHPVLAVWWDNLGKSILLQWCKAEQNTNMHIHNIHGCNSIKKSNQGVHYKTALIWHKESI